MPIQTTTAAKTRLKISLCLNLAIVVMELIGVALSAAEHGFGLFRFYTEDSNLLALAACALCAWYTYKALHSGALPQWVRSFKFVAACCLTLTFLVVIFVLAPTMGGGGVQGYVMMLFHKQMLFHHLLCPVLAFVSYVFFENDSPATLPTPRQTLYPLVPTVLYAAVALVLNLLRVLDGPYPFLRVYNQPVWLSVVWCVVIIGGDYAIIRLVRWLAGKAAARKA